MVGAMENAVYSTRWTAPNIVPRRVTTLLPENCEILYIYLLVLNASSYPWSPSYRWSRLFSSERAFIPRVCDSTFTTEAASRGISAVEFRTQHFTCKTWKFIALALKFMKSCWRSLACFLFVGLAPWVAGNPYTLFCFSYPFCSLRYSGSKSVSSSLIPKAHRSYFLIDHCGFLLSRTS